MHDYTPTFLSGVTQPLGTLRRNPGPVLLLTLAGFFGAVANMLPFIGWLISLAVVICILPTMSAVIRAHALGHKITLGEAWDRSNENFLRTLGWGFLGGVLLTVVLVVWGIGGAGMSSGNDAVFLALTVIVFGAAFWWYSMMIAAAISGVDSPFLAPFAMIPVGRSILGWLTTTVVFTAINGVLLAGFTVLLAPKEPVAAAIAGTLTGELVDVGPALLIVSLALAQITALLTTGGLSVLYDPDFQTPAASRRSMRREEHRPTPSSWTPGPTAGAGEPAPRHTNWGDTSGDGIWLPPKPDDDTPPPPEWHNPNK